MKKLAIIDFKGNFVEGFSATVKIWSGDRPTADPIAGKEGFLPGNSESLSLYKTWVEAYENHIKIAHQLTQAQDRENPVTFALKQKAKTSNASLKSDERVAYENCKGATKKLLYNFNNWLKSSQFSLIVEELKIHQPQRILIESNNFELRKMPWQKWDLLGSHNFTLTEVGLTSPNFQSTNFEPRKTSQKSASQEGVKILVVLGKDANIESTFEDFQKYQCDVTVVRNLPELDVSLWEKYWDILIFNGHSKTQGNGKQGIFQLTDGNWLTISDIKGHFRQAINHNLKVAIFNSCDGLGLAYQLAEGEDLHLPQIIVMRENLPVAVAPKFLQYFLENYTQGLSLYSSLRESRQRLQILEKDFPCVSWLPVLCQNPAEIPPRWLELGGKIEKHPYKGLSAFTENDTEIFFGRKVLTNSLLEKVERQNLVAVIGASGSGKSSLVAAGLIPQWLAQATEILPRFVVKIRPGFPHPNPWENLAEELGKISPNLTANNLAFLELVTNLEANSGELAKYLTSIVKEKNGCKILLVIDQFEELYTLCSEEKRRSFLAGLVEAVRDDSWKTVLTLRADFLSQALDEDLGKIFDERDKLITPMNDEELTEAIALPAQKFEVEFADELINRMIQDYRQNSGHLPMLQFALEELWKRQKYGVISLASYEKIGGLTQVLGDYAEKIYIGLSQEEKEQARYIFTQLVQPISQEKSGEVSRIATRKIATFADIGKENWQLVIKFADERLVVTNKEKDVASVELIHEVLITAWSRLKNWIELDWEFRRWQEKLRDNLSQWEQERKEKKDEYLLQGGLLKEAESWLEKAEQKIPEKEREYIKRGLSLRDRLRQEEEARRKRELEQERKARKAAQTRTRVAIASTVIVSVVSIFAFGQRNEAIKGEINALAAEAEFRFSANDQLGAVLASVKAARQLKQSLWLSDNEQLRILAKIQLPIYKNQERNRLEAHTDSVESVSFSPDGTMIASGSNDNTVRLWTRDGTLLKTFEGHTKRVHSVSFSPDGKMIASGSDDKTIRLWNLDGTLHKLIKVDSILGDDEMLMEYVFGTPYKTMNTEHSPDVRDTSFSPDGKMIALASHDGIRLWNLDGTLYKKISAVNGTDHISWSSDGKILAAANYKGVSLWKRDGTLIKSFETTTTDVAISTKVRLSPDGRTIAVTRGDNAVSLLDFEGKLLKTLGQEASNSKMDNIVTDIQFSPDGKMIAVASVDKTVRILEVEQDEYHDWLITFTGHIGSVNGVSFSPDGQTIVSASGDKTLRLWNMKYPNVLDDNIYSQNLRFHPDSKTFTTASYNELKQWNVDGTLRKTFKTDFINSSILVSYSLDEQKILISDWDKGVKLFKLFDDSGNLIHQFDETTQAVLSPDGKFVATATKDQKIKIWTGEGNPIRTIPYEKEIKKIDFSPDSKSLAVVDNQVRVLTLDGTLLTTLDIGPNSSNIVAFSPDRKLIATRSGKFDLDVQLWNSQGQLLRTLTHRDRISAIGDRVASISFSPDSKIIATGYRDLNLWTLDGKMIGSIQGHGGYITNVSFSPNEKHIGIIQQPPRGLGNLGYIPWVTLWSFDIDSALVSGCNLLRDYLKTNPNVSESDKRLCDETETQP